MVIMKASMKKAMLKNIVNFFTLLIGAEGTKTPVGVWFRGDPAGAFLRGGSPKHPRKAKCMERKSTGNFNRVMKKVRKLDWKH
jgi:hypothetical protein